jgi:hypothetical protein
VLDPPIVDELHRVLRDKHLCDLDYRGEERRIGRRVAVGLVLLIDPKGREEPNNCALVDVPFELMV